MRYAEAVQLWSRYHDMLPDNSSNKIARKVRGMLLTSQLFGRAQDLIRSLGWSLIKSDDGADHIVRAIHKSDPLSFLSNMFADFNRLIHARRGDNETFKGFEARFAALVSKFNSHSSKKILTQPLTALLLLSSARVEDHQRISILAAAAKDLSAKTNPASLSLRTAPTTPAPDAPDVSTPQLPIQLVQPTTLGGSVIPSLDYFNNVRYETVASILRQCETCQNNPPGRGGCRPGAGAGRPPTRRKMASNELWPAKTAQTCTKCKKFGHWSTDYNPDGS